MSAEEMKEWIAKASPGLKARIAGVLYVVSGTAYSYGEGSVRGKLVVPGDAAATAHNILSHESLYRLGFATDLISAVLFITVTLLLYDLFRPVNKSLSFGAACFSLAGCIVQAFSGIFVLAPLVILGGAPYLTAFPVEQLQALALLSLKLRIEATSIYMVCFACYNLVLGYLIFKSKFMPRIIGVFMAIAGLTYQAFLSPPLASYLFPHVLFPAGLLGEGSVMLWLIVFGVNVRRWKERASAAITI
jgi:hypothetical protein